MKQSLKDYAPRIPFDIDELGKDDSHDGIFSGRNQDELMYIEQSARDFYCLFNSDRRCRTRVPIEECRMLAGKYRDIREFATYGLQEFCMKYKLSAKQLRKARMYVNEYIEKKYHRYDGASFSDWYSAAELLESIYENEKVEIVHIFYVGKDCRVKGTYTVAGNETNAVIEMSNVVRFAPYSGAYGCFIAHNHPYSLPVPSKNDIRRLKLLDYVLEHNGIKLLDSFIVSNYSVFSMRYKKHIFVDTRLNTFKLIQEQILGEKYNNK